MSKMKIKRDDTVVVTAGKNRGKVGRVLRVLPDASRVVVEKVNLVKRHVKPQGDRPGGVVEKEASLHISNVALWNAAEGKRIKVGIKVLADGTRVRVDRGSGADIDKG